MNTRKARARGFSSCISHSACSIGQKCRPTPSPRCGLTSCGHQTGSQLTRRAHMRPMENGAEGGSRPLVFPQAQPPTPTAISHPVLK